MEEVTSQQGLNYDLRQRYALIVGDFMEEIAHHKRKRDFNNWLEALNNLFVLVEHKIYTSKKKIEEVNFKTLKDNVLRVANLYPPVWNGKLINSEGVEKIKLHLNILEMYLYRKMDEANLFGKPMNMEVSMDSDGI